MLPLLFLIPMNFWISAYLNRHGLRIAAIFHNIFFAETATVAFVLYGGPVRDFLASVLHLGFFNEALIEALGEPGMYFIAPFIVVESVCYFVVAVAFVSITVETVEHLVAAFHGREFSNVVAQDLIGVQRDFIPSVRKLFRKNCVMLC